MSVHCVSFQQAMAPEASPGTPAVPTLPHTSHLGPSSGQYRFPSGVRAPCLRTASGGAAARVDVQHSRQAGCRHYAERCQALLPQCVLSTRVAQHSNRASWLRVPQGYVEPSQAVHACVPAPPEHDLY